LALAIQFITYTPSFAAETKGAMDTGEVSQMEKVTEIEQVTEIGSTGFYNPPKAIFKLPGD
jgi:hypothetical protein